MFYVFYNLRKLFMFFFFKFGSGGPGSGSTFRKTAGWGSGSAQNECGSTALLSKMYTYFLIFYEAMKFSENNYSNIDWCFYFKQAVDVPQTVPGGGKIGANLCGTRLPFPRHGGLWDWVVECCQYCSPRGQGNFFFFLLYR